MSSRGRSTDTSGHNRNGSPTERPHGEVPGDDRDSKYDSNGRRSPPSESDRHDPYSSRGGRDLEPHRDRGRTSRDRSDHENPQGRSRRSSGNRRRSRNRDRSPSERETDRDYSPSHRRGHRDYSPSDRYREMNRDRERDFSPRDEDRSKDSTNRRRSPDDSPRERRRDWDHSPHGRRGDRDYSPHGSRRDRDNSPYDTQRDRDYSPHSGRKDRDYSPYDRRRDRDNSSYDRHRDRHYSPHSRRRDRDYSPYDRRRDRDNSPYERHRDRDYSPHSRRRDRGYSPHSRRRERDYSPYSRRRGRDYSPHGRRRNRDYSPDRDRPRDRYMDHSPTSETRHGKDDSPSERRRNRDCSPPRRNRSRDYSPKARSRNYSPSTTDSDDGPAQRHDHNNSSQDSVDQTYSPPWDSVPFPMVFGGPRGADHEPAQRDDHDNSSPGSVDQTYSPPWDSVPFPMVFGGPNDAAQRDDRDNSSQDSGDQTYSPPWDSQPFPKIFGGPEDAVSRDERKPPPSLNSSVASERPYETIKMSAPEPSSKNPDVQNSKTHHQPISRSINTKDTNGYRPETHLGKAEPKEKQSLVDRAWVKLKGLLSWDYKFQLYNNTDPGSRQDVESGNKPSDGATPSVTDGSMVTLEWSHTSNGDTKQLIYGQDENEERGNWSGRFDFILSMLGYAVGLGNVWRFPYLCYRNGGGAFLFPFLLMMVVIGLPLFYLEASLGQFSSCGAMTCWQFAPIFKGVGIAMVMVSAMTGIYYNQILAWAIYYLFASFTSDVPFASCDNDWNTKDCKLKLPIVPCTDDVMSKDGRCLSEGGREIGIWNRTLFNEVTGRKLVSSSEEYWNHVLDFSPGIEEFGLPKWDLVMCLLLAWVVCFFCLIKGIKTTGKVVYFTAIFPYVVLTILFFRGVTLENAGEGIRYFITPDFGRLSDANVWKDAANQIFFSMSIAGGGLITLSSYNRFHNNILRDSLIVAIGDSFTCVLGGFVIFSFLGYMAGQLEVDVEDVAADGAGLAFVVYPEAVSSLNPTTLWSLLFFFMLLTLGLDSQFAMIETVLTGVLDQYPHLRPKKTLVILIICCILFILGLPLTAPGGMYLLQLMDNYVGGLTLIILGFAELFAVVFIYGVTRFCTDINLMTGSMSFLYWRITWCVLSPFTIAFIFVFMFVDWKPSTYGDYTYPAWADVLGWMFTMSSVLAIPIYMVYLLCQEPEGDTVWKKLRLLTLPSVYWGPALEKHRRLVTYVQDFQVDPRASLRSRPRARYTPDTGHVNTAFQSDGTLESKSLGSRSLATSRVSMVSLMSRSSYRSRSSSYKDYVYNEDVNKKDVHESNV